MAKSKGTSPKEMAGNFTTYLEEGTTPKGSKIKSFFNQLNDSEKRVVYNNISNAYQAHQQQAEQKKQLMNARKKEISELKKKAKEFGLKVS